MTPRRATMAAAAAAACCAMLLAGCAEMPSAGPVETVEQAPPAPPTPSATSIATSPLPTWPTGPEIVASDPREWDDLTLCLNRTLLVPDGYSLGENASVEARLHAAVADVRRMLIELMPEQVARLQLDRDAGTLTVVPAAGGQVTVEDLRTAFSALVNIDFDQEAALAAVSVGVPEGRSFADQCAVYAEVTDMMQPETIASLPDDAPRLISLGLDLARGRVTVGATDPDASEFADLAAQTDLVELHYSPEISLY